MIERALFQIIQAGIEYLKTTPGAVTHFFESDGILEPGEAAKVEEYFLKEPPSVVHGYARVDNTFPLIAITLGGDQETQGFLGDEGGYIDQADDDVDAGADEFAAIFAYTINIMVYAQNPDVVLYYYQLLKQMLINGFPILKGEPCFLFDLRISGQDMAPDPAWMPAGLFVRRVTFTCSREYTQPLPATKVGRYNRVQSIHVDARGALGEDVGGVKTQIYPVNPDAIPDDDPKG